MAERYNTNPQSEVKQLALTWNPSLGLGAVECSGFEGGAMIIKRLHHIKLYNKLAGCS